MEVRRYRGRQREKSGWVGGWGGGGAEYCVYFVPDGIVKENGQSLLILLVVCAVLVCGKASIKNS